jgi:hypothetical protein
MDGSSGVMFHRASRDEGGRCNKGFAALQGCGGKQRVVTVGSDGVGAGLRNAGFGQGLTRLVCSPAGEQSKRFTSNRGNKERTETE